MQKHIMIAGIFVLLLFLTNSSLALASVEISDGTVTSLYHFEEDGVDATGNGHTLTENSVAYVDGILNHAGDTQNTGYWTATSTAMDIDGDYTIGFWIYANASLNDKRWVSRQTDSTHVDAVVYGNVCDANYAEFLHNYTTQACDKYAMTVNQDTWYYMLITRTGDRTTWYQNNSEVFAFTDNQYNNTVGLLYVNGYAGGTGYRGDFYIDELFFRNAYTNTSTRSSLYNSGSGNEICLTEGCADETPTSTPTSTTATSTTGLINTADFVVDILALFLALGILLFRV